MLKDRLRDARNAAGMTQSVLAERCGVDKSAISGYEIGRSEPNMEMLSRLMKALGVDANYLLQDEMSAYHILHAADSSDEQELIQIYRSLNQSGKTMLLHTAQAMAMNPEMKKGTSEAC